MNRNFIVFSLFFITTVYAEPLFPTKGKIYYCSKCGSELLSSFVTTQLFVDFSLNTLLCDDCRKEQSKGKDDNAKYQATLKYTGGQGEAYFLGHSTQEQLDASLEQHTRMQKYQKQDFISVCAGGYSLRVDRGGSTLFVTDPYSAESHCIMAPVKEFVISKTDPTKAEVVYHKIVEVIPFKNTFLLFPHQKETHDIYQFDPRKDQNQFVFLKEQKLIKLLSAIEGPAKEHEKQALHVKEDL